MQEIFEKYQRLLAIADAGIYYGKDIYDQERYVEMKEILVELMSRSTKETTDTLKLVLDANEGYPTPKVDVRALIRQDNKSLISGRHSYKRVVFTGWLCRSRFLTQRKRYKRSVGRDRISC